MNEIQQTIYDTFKAAGVDPILGLALAQTESNFNDHAQVLTGGDARRGGSFGVLQMSLKTGVSLDPTCTPEKLFDAKYCAILAAQLCLENMKKMRSVADLASAYNSGRPLISAPASTHAYVSRALKFYAFWQAQLTPTTSAPPADTDPTR